jgi:pimeloyl-ACP methyl ester carboxylesterase
MDRITNVVVIHGVADVSRSWHRLKPFLEPLGFRVWFFDYPTFRNEMDIPTLAADLERFVSSAIPGDPFQCVAHSQGGLIAEWYDAEHNNDRRLRRVIAVGTPFQGNSLPLLLHPKVVERWPFSRKQIRGLRTFSPVLRRLIRHRLRREEDGAVYYSIVGFARRFLRIEGDLVVAVCEANRNASYYEHTHAGIDAVHAPAETPTAVLRKNHFPLNYVRSLRKPGDPFPVLLISALEAGFDGHVPEGAFTQFAVVMPQRLSKSVEWPPDVRLVMSKATADPEYSVVFGRLKDGDHVELSCSDGNFRVRTGRFTYIIASKGLS